MEATTSALIALARHAPSAFLLDDLHLADDATLEILLSLADRIQKERLLILATYRP